MYITVKEASKIAKCTPQTVRLWRKNGYIKYLNNSNDKKTRKTLIDERKFQYFLETNRWPKD